MCRSRGGYMGIAKSQIVADEWVSFPGGELEGQRPKAMCPACRDVLNRAAASAEPRIVRGPCVSSVTAPSSTASER